MSLQEEKGVSVAIEGGRPRVGDTTSQIIGMFVFSI